MRKFSVLYCLSFENIVTMMIQHNTNFKLEYVKYTLMIWIALADCNCCSQWRDLISRCDVGLFSDDWIQVYSFHSSSSGFFSVSWEAVWNGEFLRYTWYPIEVISLLLSLLLFFILWWLKKTKAGITGWFFVMDNVLLLLILKWPRRGRSGERRFHLQVYTK